MDAELKKHIDQWLEWDKDPSTREEINSLVKAENWDELRKRLCKRIAFGTAGLRGKMQAGFFCMNNLTVQEASQGLAVSVKELIPGSLEQAVVIGYDGRHHSKEFAALTAHVFATAGFKDIKLYSAVVPTPFVPYGVMQYKACVGVMVTASHNPKLDNGYKVYWNNGCQIVSPIDTTIARNIELNLAPWTLCDAATLEAAVSDPLADISERYYADSAEHLCHDKDANKAAVAAGKAPKIVYTAMHGVGARYVAAVFERFGLAPYIGVEEQLQPDPEFPTVEFPNPEEGRKPLALAMKKADATGAKVLIATDPDADRLAVAEKSAPNGEWRIFTGDQIGTIVAGWVWETYRKRHPEVKPAECSMITTAVSSKFLPALCKKEGITFEETLTGFKWIGTCAAKHIARGQHFLFGYEEAIGYLISEMSLDKDGVRTAGFFGELYYHLSAQGRTLSDYLAELYEKYGYFKTCNKYFFCYDPALTNTIFDRIRAAYPKKIGGRWNVAHIRDLTVGYDDNQPDNKPILPVSKSTQMITFFFENGCTATLRGSGTEPKLKYYIELSGEYAKRDEIDKELLEMVAAITQECLEPEKNGLIRPSD